MSGKRALLGASLVSRTPPVDEETQEDRKRKLLVETQRVHLDNRASVAAHELAEQAEVASLEGIKLEAADQAEQLPVYVCAAFSKLLSFAREVNIPIPTPEIVFVGPKGHGKSTLLECFIGHYFNNTTGEGTKRPLQINIINNQTCYKPKCVLKRDTLLPEFDKDIEVLVEELPAQIQARNKVLSDEPIVLQYEHKQFINMILIDTPGLSLDPSDPQGKQIESIVNKLIQPTNRSIVLVRPSTDASIPVMADYVIDFVKKSDPDLTRTTFVYTRFYTQLQSFQVSKAVNKHLSLIPQEIKTYFVTLPPASVLHTMHEPESFMQAVLQANRRDMLLLEQLQYDKRYQKSIGVPAFTKQLLSNIWKSHQENIPGVLKHARIQKAEHEKLLEQLQREQDSLDANYLRVAATNYVVDILKIVEKLLTGTAEGNPGICGQTLDQEKAECGGSAQWTDSAGVPITVFASEWNIPFWQNKLYGGQQFERLLEEFKTVSDHIAISDINGDDVASASGIPKTHNLPNYLWVASDLARQKTHDAFVPLINQLGERGVFIIKRLYEIAEQIQAARKRKPSAAGSEKRVAAVSDIDQFPYFKHFCRDLFSSFVDECASKCKAKCLDEFFSTKTVYWDLAENNPVSGVGIENVADLAKTLFGRLKNRMTHNLLLKFYNFFFVPMHTDLWSHLHGKVSALSVQELEDLFEIPALKEKLSEEEVHLRELLKVSDEKEQSFLESATQFSHPTSSS